MITQEHEYYLRFILLLIQGGTQLLREIAAKALRKRNTSLKDFLSQNESVIQNTKDLSKKLKDILFPRLSTVVSHFKDYDITLLSYLITNFLTGNLDSNEKNAVDKIKEMRNVYQAHTNEARMTASTYTKEWNKLMRIICTVSHNLPEEKRNRLSELIDSIENEQLDIKVVIDEIKKLDQTNDFFEYIKKSIDDLNQNMDQRFSKVEKDILELKLKMKIQGKNTKVVNTVRGQVTLLADEQETVDYYAEKLLLEASKEYVETSQTEHNKQLKEKVGNIVEDVEKLDIKVEKVSEGSIVFEFKCFSLYALLDLINYFNSSTFKARLQEIAAALGNITGKKVNVSGSLDIQSYQDVITKMHMLERNLKMEVPGRKSEDFYIAPVLSPAAARKAIKRDYSERNPATLQTKSKIVVAAMDFGTTYSGYAFSFQHEYKENPLTMHANEWKNVAQGQMTVKAPTCLLLDPDRKMHSFGTEAKSKYMSLTETNEHADWYFFFEFKMTLHQEKEIKRNYMLKEENGKELDALTVFGLSIQYLKNHMLSVLKNSFEEMKETDVLWVITVPAIWNDSAKKFMRLAAIKAGIDKDSIEIALKPEAASIYCQQLSIGGDPETAVAMTRFSPGTRYMILYCGGGTVDVTVHEVMEDNNLKELHKATGGHWGGTVVNKAFLSFISSLVGAANFNEFKNAHKSDYMELLDEFETKKRMARPDPTEKVAIRIPFALQEIFRRNSYQPLTWEPIRSQYKDEVTILGDKLKINAHVFERFFESAIRDITAHVHDLLDTLPHPVKAILMVGGFSESPVLQKAIKTSFPKGKIEKGVIVPVDASLCVMKGAVLYGHRPSIITERVCRYTYGVAMVQPFNKRIHLAEYKIEIDGEVLCNDLFDKLVEIGQSVECGKAQAKKVYQAMSAKDTAFPIVVFRSTEKDPKYIDDRSCDFVGYYTYKQIPSSQAMRSSDVINVRFVFGNSDIKVEAIKEDGSLHKFDFKLD